METLSTLQNKFPSRPPTGGSPIRQAQESMFYHQKVHNYGPSTSRFSTKKKILEATANSKPATTHMILNYKNKFIDADDIRRSDDGDSDGDVREAKGKILNPYNAVVLSKRRDSEVVGKIMGDMTEQQQLQSTFVLPKAKNRIHFPSEATSAKLDKLENRIFVGKIDMQTQTDGDLIKRNFVGLTGYQEWSRSHVEPFLKELRNAIKANRPENIPSYISAYCAAYEGGMPQPVTVPRAQTPKIKMRK
jgi:hypothetical protein